MPGGVSSPVRAFKAVGGEPIIVSKGEGSRIWDVEGKEYIDFLMSWGPLILGHSHPRVVKALEEQAKKGLSYGITNPHEITLAELVISAMPSVEMVRFVSSGTEATMSAIRLARGYTGTIVLPYNDVDALKEAFERYGQDIACVIVEPVAGNMGTVLPRDGFLQALERDYKTILLPSYL
jgi:glutamate-1-semialdehyde 2,1-aminomutase